MASFWRGVLHYEKGKVAAWTAARNAFGVALPLAVGAALGYPTSGLIAGTGALNVAFSDGADPYAHRLRRMASASVCCAFAVFTGGLCGRHHLLATLVAGACAFAAGMMVAVGTEATDIANVALVTLIVYSAQTMNARQAAGAGLAALAGGLLQTSLALIFWPFRPYQPERLALAALFAELGRAAGEGPRVMESPPATAQSSQAQTALASLGSNHSIEAERYLALLSQGERIRLALLSLARARVRLARAHATTPEGEVLERYLKEAGRLLAGIAAFLRGESDSSQTGELEALAEKLRAGPASGDILHTVDALTGQIRSAREMAEHDTPAGTAEFGRRDAARPWALRVSSTFAVLRANVNLQSAVMRHALRLAACVTVGELLAPWLRRGYWMPMTSSIVLRPDFTTTFNRGILRVAGTLLGLGLATALFHLMAPAPGIEIVLIAMFTLLLRYFGPGNYGIFALNLSALVVLLFAVTGIEPGGVIAARALNTIAGGVLALVAYQLWPTWERTQAADSIARLFDAYREYFRTLRDAYVQTDRSFAAELDGTRQRSRLARSNAEASVTRLGTEPGVPAERLTQLNAVLANSHRFIQAAMSLEAGLTRSRSAPVRDAFQVFATHVDLTLYFLAAALRGAVVNQSDLPDLRADQIAMVHTGDPHIERYALSNVEADRIANSLNTLAGEILGRAG